MATMNQRLICSGVLLAIVAAIAFAQTTPTVHQAYYSKADTILVKTDRLVLLDTPSQFLEIQFAGRCARESTAPPTITMELYSRSLAPLYQKDNDHRLSIVADKEITNLGLLSYESLQEIEDQVRDIYPLSGPHPLVKRIPTPATAQIKSSNPGRFLVAEIMSSRLLTLALINKIAQANALRLQLGSSAVDFNGYQKSVLLEFARGVNLPDPNAPLADARPFDEKPVDLAPLDLNNASLETTMDWLAKALAINGRIITPQGAPARFEMIERSGCTFTVTLDADREIPPYEIGVYSPKLEFTANLAYLNPELIRVDDSQVNSRVWVATTNQKYKIDVCDRQGGTGKPFNKRPTLAACFDLRKNGSAFMVRDAIIHAIKLCQAQQNSP